MMSLSRVKRVAVGACAAVLACVLVVSCQGQPGARSLGAPVTAPRLTVAAGTYALVFLAEQIGGSEVQVRSVAEKAIDPHDVPLSGQDKEMLAGVDVALTVGQSFQPQLVDALADMPEVSVVDVAQAAQLENFQQAFVAVEGDPLLSSARSSHVDPHFWLDPQRMMAVAPVVAAGFAEADPERAAEYEARGRGVVELLGEIDGEFEAGLRRCEHTIVPTNRPAFSYLGQRYGLEPVTVLGMSPDFVPGPELLSEMTDFVAKENAPTLFYDAVHFHWVPYQVSRATGAQVALLDPMLGTTERYGTSEYPAIMRLNLVNLRRGLNCR